jgi:23S rRNA pseudouridine1911/1915/1917 synthase
MPILKVRVEPISPAQRIDVYLAEAELGLSRSQIKRLFGEGRVNVDGKKVRISHKVQGGEEVVIDQPDQKPIPFVPEEIPLDIVFEDDYIAVVNKPAGMVVHPATRNESGTLANALLYHFQHLSSGYEKGYPGLVHRLDKNTTGLMVVAKNDQIHAALGEQLQERTLRRGYRALIWGTLQPRDGTISIPIGRSRSDRRLMSSGSAKPREAITDYETIEEFEFLSYINVNLRTGRTHQIRTHLKEKSHPVFGDPEYGGRGGRLAGIRAGYRAMARKLLNMTSRQLLHAARLRLIHPVTGKSMEFEKQIPEDFGQVLATIRQYQGGISV